MKRTLFLAGVSLFVFIASCNSHTESNGNHTHNNGSIHNDHDTIKPVQQEFNVADTIKKDTSTHTHENGEKHSH